MTTAVFLVQPFVTFSSEPVKTLSGSLLPGSALPATYPSSLVPALVIAGIVTLLVYAGFEIHRFLNDRDGSASRMPP